MARKRKLSDLIGEETQQTERTSQTLEETRGLQGREFDSRHSPSSNDVSSSIESTANDSVTAEVSELVTNKVSDIQSNKVPNSEKNKVTELRTTKITDSQNIEISDSQTDELPKYLKLVRKEARLREDQLDSLTSLTRSLNRQRKGSGERITENTLIRVAVDLLMNQSDELKGTTEQELKKSVSLKVTD
jgi:hypothetical protein